MANPAVHPKVECIWSGAAILGEGPFWCKRSGQLFFVDIIAKTLFRLDPATGVTSRWVFDEEISCIDRTNVPGIFIIALRSGLYHFDPETGNTEARFLPPKKCESQRLNDGCADRFGGFWIGTMDDNEKQNCGTVYRLGKSGHTTEVDTGYGVTNGPAFSPDGSTVYVTDSKARTIFKLQYDFDENKLLSKSVFTQLPSAEGCPDGMVCTKAGYLWVACWDGWCIRRYSPAGDLVDIIHLPVQRPTSVTFGANEKTLYVTSATVGLSKDDLGKQRDAGGVFRVLLA